MIYTSINYFINEKNLKESTNSIQLYNLINKKFVNDIIAERPYDPLLETIDIKINNLHELDNLLKFIKKHKWYISKNKLNHSKYIEIKPIYSSGKIENIPHILYHATSINNIQSINKHGIISKSEDIRHKYPPRIYVTDNLSSLKMLITELKKWKGNSEYAIYEINSNNLIFDLYKDITCAYKGCYYMQDIKKIPIDNIKLIEIN